MDISELFDPVELEKEIAQGYVSRRVHPDRPLTLYCYTRACQYEWRWNDVTRNCRGLIVDKDGTIVARPFPKFFNQGDDGETAVPDAWWWVSPKIDGSLAIVYHYGEIWDVATKGSFISDQAAWARAFLTPTATADLDPGLTYCAELIHPANRIVVDYGMRRDLVLLACFDVATGTERSVIDSWRWRKIGSVNIEERLGTEPIDFEGLAGTAYEGYVAVSVDRTKRVKVKNPDYLRLHKLLTGFTERDIWRLLGADILGDGFGEKELAQALKCSEDDVRTLLASRPRCLETAIDAAPEDFREWATAMGHRLEITYQDRLHALSDSYLAIRKSAPETDDQREMRKDFAAKVGERPVEDRGVLFAMLDGKPYQHLVWRQLYPAATKAFMDDDE